jgi:hypothetical protein
MNSIVSIASRSANSDETIQVLSRLKQTLDEMGDEHAARSASDHLAIAEINYSALPTGIPDASL